MNDFLIRNCEVEDLDAVLAIECKIGGATAYNRTVLRQLYDICGELFKVAVDSRLAIIGYVVGCPVFESKDAWILSLMVSPSSRRIGIGSKLTLEFCNEIKRYEYKRILLSVAPYNSRAIALYEKQGFEVVEMQANYLESGENRLLMQKKIERACPRNSAIG